MNIQVKFGFGSIIPIYNNKNKTRVFIIQSLYCLHSAQRSSHISERVCFPNNFAEVMNCMPAYMCAKLGTGESLKCPWWRQLCGFRLYLPSVSLALLPWWCTDALHCSSSVTANTGGMVL